ncbi:hypothetical protein PGSY75_1435600 [Plasmodium gaboni]|uniref:Uncharacterized protein n=1 Tax=Plasmodium gaboni TaxID=647221 RepID=A0A151LAH4_9APIC|nr:hypothetical protein PGSY75_1435600 [Plasmodium gaboni]KYN95951.1 hypothetical protein PGSY75_1435600 [Plasmodium gaboni]
MKDIIDEYEIVGKIEDPKEGCSNGIVEDEKKDKDDKIHVDINNDGKTLGVSNRKNEKEEEKKTILSCTYNKCTHLENKKEIYDMNDINNIKEEESEYNIINKDEGKKMRECQNIGTGTIIKDISTDEKNKIKCNDINKNECDINKEDNNKNNITNINKMKSIIMNKNENEYKKDNKQNNNSSGSNNNCNIINKSTSHISINMSDRCSNVKHYKVLIHAPACWKGEKFNGTPFIFVYDKSINFYTYSESPLEIEKYIIDTNDEDFENRVLTIIFYDSLFACSTSCLLINNNKNELQHLPKPLSVFYLPLCKLDLENDSVKYRLGLKTNSILCNININEAISLFNNSTKLSGQNINKFSLHFFLKNNNYLNNNNNCNFPYNYLNYNTKIYGIPRSNLSSCVQKHALYENNKYTNNNNNNNNNNINNISNNSCSSTIGKRHNLNSSKSQVHYFKTNNSGDLDEYISLDKIKSKWEQYAHINNTSIQNNIHSIKNDKVSSHIIKNEKNNNDNKVINLNKYDSTYENIGIDNESFTSKMKSDIYLNNRQNMYDNINQKECKKNIFLERDILSKQNNKKKEAHKNNYNNNNNNNNYNNYNNKFKRENTNISRKDKSDYNIYEHEEKYFPELDIKDDVLPDDSASMIHIRDKDSIISGRSKKMYDKNKLTTNFNVAHNIFSTVKQIIQKKSDEKNMEKNKNEENTNSPICNQNNMNNINNINNNNNNICYDHNRESSGCDSINENTQEKNKTRKETNFINDDKSVCYSQVSNLKYFNTNNSICSSYGKNDEHLILAIKEIKDWMEKIEDKVSTISACDKSDVNVTTNGLSRCHEDKYNRLLKFLIKSVKNNIKLKNKSIYKRCYLNIRNLYLVKKNDKIKFENKLLERNYNKMKTKYRNVLVNICKKIFLLKYYSMKDKLHFNKKYENMMRHLQLEKNDLLSVIEEKKYELENNVNLNHILSEQLKKSQEEKEDIINKNFYYEKQVDNVTKKYEHLHNDVITIREEIEQLQKDNHTLKKNKENLLNENDIMKKENDMLKNENDMLKKESDMLKKELGETKAKYFNLTGILEGEEKMYSQKVQELEEKLQKVTYEKNNMINDIKDEIDKFTILINEKDKENMRIKDKLKELKNVEEKYKNTQKNFDSLKKEFEESFEQVQIILNEMIQKEKEYTKKYNNSITSLEKEHNDMIQKMIEDKNLIINQVQYYKDLCKNQCNKIITFDESLITAEKLLEHVLSQYPQLFNEFKNNSRNNLLNKSFGKMHYENIHAVRDNIKLIRKSLNHFKMTCKNNSFQFFHNSESTKKYTSNHYNHNKNINHHHHNNINYCHHNYNSANNMQTYNSSNKRVTSLLRNYEKKDSQKEYKNKNINVLYTGRKRTVSSNNSRNNSVLSNCAKKNIDLRKKIDSYNSLFQKSFIEATSKYNTTTQKIKKKNSDDIMNTYEDNTNMDINKEKKDLQSEHHNKNMYNNENEFYVTSKKKHVNTENNESIQNSYDNINKIINDITNYNEMKYNQMDILNEDNLSKDINELNTIDIVNMYEKNNSSNNMNDSEHVYINKKMELNVNMEHPENNKNEIIDDINIHTLHMNKSQEDNSSNLDNNNNNIKHVQEFDKDNFKEVISFIEKNVIKNIPAVKNSDKNTKEINKLNVNNVPTKLSTNLIKHSRQVSASVNSSKSLNIHKTNEKKNIRALSDNSPTKKGVNNISTQTKVYTTHNKCKNIEEVENDKRVESINAKSPKASLRKKIMDK